MLLQKFIVLRLETGKRRKIPFVIEIINKALDGIQNHGLKDCSGLKRY
jgi:hypothetical protein